MTELIKGCIVDALMTGKIDVLAHITNCVGKFNSGVAKGIRNKLPSVYSAYMLHVDQLGHTNTLLGRAQCVKPAELSGKIVYNLYAQADWDRGWRIDHVSTKKQINYGAFAESLLNMTTAIWKECELNRLPPPIIGMPWLCGSVRGGGDWNVVQEHIEWALRDLPHVYYEYTPSGKHNHVR